ncbi:MAG TPA: fluoride efflux transporter CrcB [Candidatus Limnocylindrales bacterium]|nr:fluoride efflux transporter CrcB [Candidatus Limnocylindrales bacterium]
MTLLLVGLGGFLGAATRYLVDGWVSAATGGTFPWGTLAINLSGSFILGVLFGIATERAILPADVRPAVMIGFIGAYTTFSTWMLESARLIEDGALAAALLNVGGSVVLGIVAVFLGLAVGRVA